MGDIFGGGSQTVESAPWGPIQPHLENTSGLAYQMLANSFGGFGAPQGAQMASSPVAAAPPQFGLGTRAQNAGNASAQAAQSAQAVPLGALSAGNARLNSAVLNPSSGTLSALRGLGQLGRNNSVTQGAMGALDGLYRADTSVDPRNVDFGIQGVRDSIAAEVLPQVAGMFGQGGFANSTTAQQVGSQALTNALAPYEFQQRNMNADRAMQQQNMNIDRGLRTQLSAIGLAPTVNQMQVGDIGLQGQVGDYWDSFRQRRADQGFEAIQNAARIFGGLGGLGGNQSQSNNPGFLETVGGLGQAAGNAALAFSLFCDRRLKTDIEHAGFWRGVKIYLFRYFFDKPGVRRIGPMAQEVPDRARIVLPGGMLAVDMRAL